MSWITILALMGFILQKYNGSKCRKKAMPYRLAVTLPCFFITMGVLGQQSKRDSLEYEEMCRTVPRECIRADTVNNTCKYYYQNFCTDQWLLAEGEVTVRQGHIPYVSGGGGYLLPDFTPPHMLMWGKYVNGFRSGRYSYLFHCIEFPHFAAAQDSFEVAKSEMYKMGILEGEYRVIDYGRKQDGSKDKLLYSTTFKNGTGYYKDYNCFGVLLAEGWYKNNYKEGVWKYYKEWAFMDLVKPPNNNNSDVANFYVDGVGPIPEQILEKEVTYKQGVVVNEKKIDHKLRKKILTFKNVTGKYVLVY